MPELPDVEIFRRQVTAWVLNRRIRSIEELSPEMLGTASPAELRDALEGATLEDTARHGKHLFVRLDERGWLALHFGMTGDLLHVEPGGRRPPNARLLLEMDDGDRLAYTDVRKLGRMDLTLDVGSFVARRRLGPDALDASRKTFAEALAIRRGALKPALMNQRVLAGVGNLYADEICFQARLDPRTRIDRLEPGEIGSLHGVVKRVLRTAIERTANASALPRTWLLPRRGEGETCPRGDGRIERTRLGSRSTYFCPSCQGRR